MRVTKLALFLLLGALLGSRMAHSQPADRQGDDAGTRYFHQRLTPYGQWGTHAGYGEVWRPRVAAGWRPYTTGHWVYSDYGWAWEADEPWGWAAFHYGRWYHDSEGWGWVPGNVWAPAWVDWRNGNGYVGWAALPPEVGFTAGVGVSFGSFDLNAALVPSYYSFVPERSILEPRLGTFIVSPARNGEIIRGTSDINGIGVVNNRVFNQGMSVQRFEQVSGHPVPRVRVGNQAAFYQPAVVANAARQTRTESFVNRPAPRAASAGTPGVPTGSRTANRQESNTRSAKPNAAPGAIARRQSRSATQPNQGQNGRNPVSRAGTRRASPNHATPRTVASSRAAARNPPPTRTQQASARPSSPPRRVASAKPSQHGMPQGSARPNPPPRRAGMASQRPAQAPAQTKPRQQPPPPSGEQPQQVQKQRSAR